MGSISRVGSCCAIFVLMLLSGLDVLLDENRLQELELLYSLFSRVKAGLTELKAHFITYIKVTNFIKIGTFSLDLFIFNRKLVGP